MAGRPGERGPSPLTSLSPPCLVGDGREKGPGEDVKCQDEGEPGVSGRCQEGKGNWGEPGLFRGSFGGRAGHVQRCPPASSLCQAVAEEKLSVWERRLQGLEVEAESLRQKHQREISEYQEQVKQHARTIVELEKRLSSAAQQPEEERRLQPRGQSKWSRGSPGRPSVPLGRRGWGGLPCFLLDCFAPKPLAPFVEATQQPQGNQAANTLT